MQWFFWIISLLAAAGAGYIVYRADRQRAVPMPWLTALLRALVIMLTLLLLLAPSISINKNETQKPVVLFLQDNSISAGHALGADSANYRQHAEELANKLSDKYRVVRWAFGNRIQTDSSFNYHQEETDISGAINRAQEYYGLQNLGAIILATDGRYNRGNNPLYQQTSLHSPVYTVGLGDSTTRKDLRIAQAYANRVVALNSQFELRADVIATLCNGYQEQVRITENGSTLASAGLSISSDRYDRSVAVTIKADKPGLHHYVIEAPAAASEENTANNRKDVFVEVVEEKKNILILSGAPHPDVNAIREALSTVETYQTAVYTADKMPADIGKYDAIILHQLPSMQMDVPAELKDSKKPIWYILGSQSNPGLLNQMERLAFINTAPGTMQDAVPAINKSFNIFNLPQDVQAVADRLPPLGMQSGTVKASADASILFSQRTAPNNPLWILQQGTPPHAMLTGEGIWRWRLYEYRYFNKHDAVDECIRQTVAFLTANSNDRPFSITMPKYVWSDKESIVLNAYLLNANNQQINTPEVKLIIADSTGNKQNYTLERAGNSYRLNIGLRAGGRYMYAASTSYNGKNYSAAGSFAVESMPLELMETGADFPLLYALAHKYNGGFVPAAQINSLYDSIAANNNIKPVIINNTETVPLVDWKWYFFLILLLAVAEWLLRKYWLAQ